MSNLIGHIPVRPVSQDLARYTAASMLPRTD
jgi:hypothetical protein